MSPVVLVAAARAAADSRAAAAALACAGSDADRAALLVDLGCERPPRPSLLATAAARALEERLAAHMPEVGIASRGSTCHLALEPGEVGIERIPAALPLVRDSAAILHLPAPLARPVLEEARIGATGALLVVDLARDRALAALAVGDLVDRGLRVAVLKRPLGRLAARRALLGVLPATSGALPPRAVARLLEAEGEG